MERSGDPEVLSQEAERGFPRSAGAYSPQRSGGTAPAGACKRATERRAAPCESQTKEQTLPVVSAALFTRREQRRVCGGGTAVMGECAQPPGAAKDSQRVRDGRRNTGDMLRSVGSCKPESRQREPFTRRRCGRAADAVGRALRAPVCRYGCRIARIVRTARRENLRGCGEYV